MYRNAQFQKRTRMCGSCLVLSKSACVVVTETGRTLDPDGTQSALVEYPPPCQMLDISTATSSHPRNQPERQDITIRAFCALKSSTKHPDWSHGFMAWFCVKCEQNTEMSTHHGRINKANDTILKRLNIHSISPSFSQVVA